MVPPPLLCFPGGASARPLLAAAVVPLVCRVFPTAALRTPPAWIRRWKPAGAGVVAEEYDTTSARRLGANEFEDTVKDSTFAAVVSPLDVRPVSGSALALLLDAGSKDLAKTRLPSPPFLAPRGNAEAHSQPELVRCSFGGTAVSPHPVQWSLDAVVTISGFTEPDMRRNARVAHRVLQGMTSCVAASQPLTGVARNEKADTVSTLKKREQKYFDFEAALHSGACGVAQMLLSVPTPNSILRDVMGGVARERSTNSDGSGGEVGGPDADLLGPAGVSSVVFRVGFGCPSVTASILNLQRSESDRAPMRVALGFSVEILKERLPQSMIDATRRLLKIWQGAVTHDAQLPPVFWLSSVGHVAALVVPPLSVSAAIGANGCSSLVEFLVNQVLKHAVDFLVSLRVTADELSRDAAGGHHLLQQNFFLPVEHFTANFDCIRAAASQVQRAITSMEFSPAELVEKLLASQ